MSPIIVIPPFRDDGPPSLQTPEMASYSRLEKMTQAFLCLCFCFIFFILFPVLLEIIKLPWWLALIVCIAAVVVSMIITGISEENAIKGIKKIYADEKKTEE